MRALFAKNWAQTWAQTLYAVPRILFVLLVAYPVVWLWLGTHVRHRERLPHKGAAIVVANHRSHLDILVLLTLFPLWSVPRVHAVAASDYFLRNRFLAWISLNLIGIIPLQRTLTKEATHPLQACFDALEAGKTLIIFPEGTRSTGEHMAPLKYGIWYVAKRFPEVPVIPVYLQGLGKAMPKGSVLPLPIFVGVAIGSALFWYEGKQAFIDELQQRFFQLQQKLNPAHE
jgi:1-acyl-sn-glycerol-3-phosphate acyltransferase